MPKVKRNTDIAVLIVVSLISLNAIYQHFAFGYGLSINNYFGYFLLISYIIYRLITKEPKQYFVFMLLLLSTFNVIGFSNAAINTNVALGYGDSSFELPSFDPIFFILLTVYCFINKEFTRYIFRLVFKPSQEEIESKRQTMIKFYYDKFSGMDRSDIYAAFSKIEDYPIEAQVALERLTKEKEN